MPKFSLISNFERALYLFSLPQKYRILVRHATLTAIHGPSHSGQTPSVPRLANQYLCEMNMSMRASASLHILIQNASFFLAPFTGTYLFDPNHRGQDSPHREQSAISSYFTNRSIQFCITPGCLRLRYVVFFTKRVALEQI